MSTWSVKCFWCAQQVTDWNMYTDRDGIRQAVCPDCMASAEAAQ